MKNENVKIFGAVAMVMVLLISMIGVGSAYTLPGDVDSNGIVDERDVHTMMIALNNHLNTSEYPDMDGDGVFGYHDIALIKKIYSSMSGGSRNIVCPTTTTHIVGDMNGDGRLNGGDVFILRFYIYYGRVIGNVGKVIQAIGL